MIPLITGQTLEIQDLTNYKGILPMTLGTAKTIKGYRNLLHIIRLENYERNIDKITDTISKFENIKHSAEDTLKIVKLKLKELHTKLNTLSPKFRNKRGLINGLGTVIKSITGNLDANDAIKLNKEIDEILNNQNEMNKAINQNTKLNNKMIERFENITEHINEQQNSIIDYLNRTQNSIENTLNAREKLLRYMQFVNEINFNIDLLDNHLSSISEAIVFAKLGIIPKQILNQEELLQIQLLFQNQNVTIVSDEHIYELLELAAYYNNTNIIFNIKIPIISQEAYTLFHVIPLPDTKNNIIPIKPYVIINPNNIQYLENKCPHIEGVYYCQPNSYAEATNTSQCIGNLLNNKLAHCEIQQKELLAEIYQPEPNYIILLNVPKITITTTCGPARKTIRGSILIHFKECEIEINGITYSSVTYTHLDEIYIYPTTFAEINTSTNHNQLRLKQLENYQFAKKELLGTSTPFISYKQFYTSSGLLTIIFLITIFIMIAVTYKKHRDNSVPCNIPVNTAPSTFIWPALGYRGGGVTCLT